MSQEPRVIQVDGVITNNTLHQIRQDLAGWKNQDPIPGGLIVLLNSPGGNGEVAMQIGRILRRENAQAFVVSQCESACVFILAGAVVRAADTASIGVHAGRLTLTNRSGVIIKEIDSSQSLENSFKLTSFNSQANQYLSEMGIRNGLIDAMLAHQTKQTYKLTELEMQQFGIVGFDNQYLRKRGDLFSTLPQADRVNRIELYNRTLSVPRLCKGQNGNSNTFLECYKAVLFGKIPL
ncbi:hypothetical protein [Polynucleobacter sp. MWH-UH35A]|uniref:hypothetical protein n=1 Tax=Polynucleobacter sp. MWH-UH35A TaxID=1855619 RepID=UPI001BFD0D32|nr:hypothetical protein [Polynucleobacter sp. MWH-UH35A]QWD59562.1 hypothetical protein ICV36_07060 [Polynucleobacter sp. MWH-UH35A]